MSTEEYIVQTDRSEGFNDKEPKYDSDGNLVDKGEESGMLLSEEEEDGSDESEEEDLSDYMRLRAERMARNHDRLVELGLIAEEGGSTINRDLRSKKQNATSAMTATPASVSEVSNKSRTPTRKIPRLQLQLAERTIDLVNVSTVVASDTNNSTTTTPLIQDMTINMSGGSERTATLRVSVAATLRSKEDRLGGDFGILISPVLLMQREKQRNNKMWKSMGS